MVRLPLRLLFCLVVACAACGDGKSLGPPDSYSLLAPAKAASADPAGAPVMRAMDVAEAGAQPLVRLFAEGFASEMLRTVYMMKQFVREARPGGQPFPEAGRALADEGLPVVIGLDRDPYDRGLALARWLRSPAARPDVPWIGLPADLERDKALVQTVSGRLATLALHLSLTGGTFASPEKVVSPLLGSAYRMAMEVIAREWRVGKGPTGVVPWDAGTLSQRTLFASIRENRFVLTADRQSLRSPDEMLSDPGVAATVIYRLAQSKAIANRLAVPTFYEPLTAGRLPQGISPAAVLGAFRNFQAKLLGAWATAVQTGHVPQDIVDLVDVYVAAYPAEKAEVLRVFIVTTFAATVEAGGVSTRPQDSSKAISAIDAAVAEVIAGKKTLRAAAGKKAPGSSP